MVEIKRLNERLLILRIITFFLFSIFCAAYPFLLRALIRKRKKTQKLIKLKRSTSYNRGLKQDSHVVLEISVPLTYPCTTGGAGGDPHGEEDRGDEEEDSSHQLLSVSKVAYAYQMCYMYYLVTI